MYTTFISAALFASVAIQGAVAQSAFTVNTPTISQCGDVHISWSGAAKGPVNVIVVPADKPCDDVLFDLGDHDSNSITWKKAAVKPGQKLLISLEDAGEEEAWSKEIVVGDSDDASCLSGSDFAPSSASGSASGSKSATGSAATGTAATATTLTVSPSGPVGGVESAAPSSSVPVVGPVGAAGAGLTGGSSNANGAASLHAPAALFGALAAVLVLAL